METAYLALCGKEEMDFSLPHSAMDARVHDTSESQGIHKNLRFTQYQM
jgi:hypothetical protein